MLVFMRLTHSDESPPSDMRIKQRHDFALQKIVDVAGVDRVLIFGVFFAVADRPAAGDLVRFVEPAIENGEIQHAVHGRPSCPWCRRPLRRGAEC